MRPRTRRLLQASALGTLLTLVTCCVPAPAPTPAPAPPPPRPAPVPTPAPTSTPVQSYTNWRDVPQSPGDWSYRATPEGSAAQFGRAPAQVDFSLLCRRAQRSIDLVRSGALIGAPQMIVRTTNRDGAVEARAVSGGQPNVTASLAANDPLLDAIAFSRGRFSIEVPGLASLYLPAWPEVMRVIEDCR